MEFFKSLNIYYLTNHLSREFMSIDFKYIIFLNLRIKKDMLETVMKIHLSVLKNVV